MARSSVKDRKTYRAVRDQGASKQKAARIANASANTSRSAQGRKGGKAGDYEQRTKADLYQEAAKVGVAGRSTMSKPELIKALRKH